MQIAFGPEGVTIRREIPIPRPQRHEDSTYDFSVTEFNGVLIWAGIAASFGPLLLPSDAILEHRTIQINNAISIKVRTVVGACNYESPSVLNSVFF